MSNIEEIAWENGGLSYQLINRSGFYCGYVRFPERPVREEGHDGLLTYVPVHGGITYANTDGQSAMYGFDCAHLGDASDPRCSDVDWLKAECERMGAGILTAGRYEDEYLRAASYEEKAAVIGRYHEEMARAGVDVDMRHNIGAMLKALSGEL